MSRKGYGDIPKEYWIDQFWTLIDFLQSRNLMEKKKFLDKISVNEESKLMAEDLTEIGLEVLRIGLGPWHKANDSYPKYQSSGITVRPLENALKKVIANSKSLKS